MSRLLWLPALLMLGCATPTLYSWGLYEELIYVSYAAPGKASPEMQVEKLEQDYQKARAENKRMPPGFHAHLGYLYFQLGKLDQARQELETEKAEFPESAVFMDRLLANLRKFLSARRLIPTTGCAVAALMLAGCATTSYDYTNLRQHPPRSILVLPPLNESTAVEATWGYLSTVTRPLAERGYYVFPIAVVDQFLKENGLPGAGEMHQVPLPKVTEILGADAVLFITVEQYGTKYQVLNAATIVKARAKLVDTRTGLLLWEGKTVVQQNSSGSGNLLADVISAALTQVLNTTSDAAHRISGQANVILFNTKDQGLLYGPYHPTYDKGE